MQADILSHIPSDFPDEARVWIYQASRQFLISEALEIGEMIEEFLAGWNSHGRPVKGYGNLFFGRFLILMADERASAVSGCSTDSSVALVRDIQERFGTDMFNRQLLAFLAKGKIELIPLSQYGHARENGFISGDTIYFNNNIQTKIELQEKWMIPVKNSWLHSYATSST